MKKLDENFPEDERMIVLARWDDGGFFALTCTNTVESLFWEMDVLANPNLCNGVWINQHDAGAVSHEDGLGELDVHFDGEQIKKMFSDYMNSDDYPPKG